jgi:hypothetical protein
MQSDPSPNSGDVLRDSSVIEAGIYDRLTMPDQQRPWAVRELVLEIGDQIEVEDALTRLHGVGLVHTLRRVRVGDTRGARSRHYRVVGEVG